VLGIITFVANFQFASGVGHAQTPILTETEQLTESNPAPFGYGAQTRAFGPWLFVCAPIHIDPRLAHSPRLGMIYVYRRSSAGYELSQTLSSPSSSRLSPLTRFGHAAMNIEVDDDTLIVGDGWDFTNGRLSGQAYIYERQGLTWALTKTLVSPRPMTYAGFGGATSVSGDGAVVGAPREDFYVVDAGAVYVYRRQAASGDWALEAELFSPSLQSFAPNGPWNLGIRVVMDGDTVAVSSGRSTIHVFEKSNMVWSEVAYLFEPALENYSHGYALALSGDWLAVGRPAIPYLNFPVPGQVYVYRRVGGFGGSWSLHQILQASNAATYANASDHFGISIALEGSRMLVGADAARGGAGNRPYVGQAYLFELGQGTWIETQRLSTARLEGLAPGDQVQSALARDVAFGDGVFVATDSGGDVLNGVVGPGRAYVFEQPRGQLHCTGTPGGPWLAITGVPDVQFGGLTCELSNLIGFQGGILAATRVGSTTPVGPGVGGGLCLTGPGLRLGAFPLPAPSGTVTGMGVDVPNIGFLVGETWAFQALCRWQGGLAASNAVALTLQ